MKIRNKLESVETIKRKKLNSFVEKIFYRGQQEEVSRFLEKYPAKFYAVRSKEIVGCKENNFKVLKDDVLKEIEKFNLFSINVSSYNYVSNLILIDDIMIRRNNDVWFIGSTNPNFTRKLAERYPDFNYSTDIFDKRLNLIPGFDLIYGYIIDHDLVDVIVEFAIYNCLVGIYNEQIVIFEIRTEF